MKRENDGARVMILKFRIFWHILVFKFWNSTLHLAVYCNLLQSFELQSFEFFGGLSQTLTCSAGSPEVLMFLLTKKEHLFQKRNCSIANRQMSLICTG